MLKLFNCLTIVFATIMFVSCNGKEPKQTEPKFVVLESEKDPAKKDGGEMYIDYEDSTAWFNRYRDTIDVETFLSGLEKRVIELKELHVKSLDDTIILGDKFSKIDSDLLDDSIYVDLNPDHLLHSQKVRSYQVILSFFDELFRLNEELTSVGYTKAKSIEENEDGERLLEFRDAVQEALYRELN